MKILSIYGDVLLDLFHSVNLQGANLQGAYLRNAYSRGANLQYVNLRNAYLQGANLQYANLRNAYLQGANLQGAYLQDANLQGANLQGANLQDVNLRDAYLQGANLQYTNLRNAYLQGANLQGAYLQGANLPSPSMVLLAYWGNLSREGTIKLMQLDTSAHPNPERFIGWFNDGECPYNKSKTQRVANFKEVREFYIPGNPPTLWEAMCLVLNEKCQWDGNKKENENV